MFVFSWALLQYKIVNNRFKQNMKDFVFRDVLHPFIILFGLMVLYIFLHEMFRFTDRRGLSSFDFAFTLLSFSLLVFLPLLIYSAIVCALSFLFQKDELHFYFSLPVNKLSVFTVKFLQAYLHTTWMAFLGIFTFLVAIQTYFKVSVLIYFTGAVSFMLFLLIPVCLGMILVIVISRFFPFVQSRNALTVIGLLTASVLISVIRLMQPERLVTAEGKMRLVTYLQNLYKPWMTALPSEWTTTILFAQTQNNSRAVTINFMILFIVASLLVVVMYLAAGLFYKKAWADNTVMSPAVRKEAAHQVFLTIFPSALRGFIRKDLLTFERDTIEKGSLLTLIPLCFIYLYSMYILNRQVQAAGQEPIFSFLYLYLFNFFYASITIAGLSGRWVLPGVSAEGNNFKLIKESPASLSDFLKAKFLLGFIPLLLLGEFLVVSSSLLLHFKLNFILISAVTMGLLCYGIVLISLIVGMRQADFTISSPLDFALSMRGFLFLTWALAFVMFILILIGAPTMVFLSKGFSFSFFMVLAVTLFLIIAFLVIFNGIYKTSIIKLSKREV